MSCLSVHKNYMNARTPHCDYVSSGRKQCIWCRISRMNTIISSQRIVVLFIFFSLPSSPVLERTRFSALKLAFIWRRRRQRFVVWTARKSRKKASTFSGVGSNKKRHQQTIKCCAVVLISMRSVYNAKHYILSFGCECVCVWVLCIIYNNVLRSHAKFVSSQV